jgi:hypothetical protein
MSEWIAILIYVLVSASTYVGLLRLSSREFGVSWFTVFWSLFAFFPVVGQVTLVIVWLTERDTHGPAIPKWLQRLAGE